MAITRASNSGITTGVLKYDSMLVGRLPLPSVPTIGTATAGDTTASVAFTAGPIAGTTYRALSTPGSISATGTTSPISVTGLTNGTSYTFQVRAENSTGNSAYSSASNSVTPVSPLSYESIATATGTGSSGVITFSNIPGTFKHLQIRYIGKSTQTTTNARYDITIQANGVSTSVYSNHYLRGLGTTASATGSGASALTQITLQGNVPSSAAGYASMHGVGIIDIIDYADTSKYKTIRTLNGSSVNSASNDMVVMNSGSYQQTTAITSLTLTLATGSWTTTSVFGLFGIKG